MTERFELECCGEPVTMVVDDDGVTFHGWDEDAELALIELGFEPSLCWIVADAIRRGILDEELLEQAKSGNAPAVEVLLAANANAATAGERGNTPMHWAAVKEHADVVEILLTTNTDVNATNKLGVTPLHWAARYGHAGIVKILLKAGADAKARDGYGDTPLHLAPDGIVKILEAWTAEHPRQSIDRGIT